MTNNSSSIVISTIIISVFLLIAIHLAGRAFQNRNKANKVVSVTGLGERTFTADLIVWNGSFTRKNIELKEAYASLHQDLSEIKRYLNSNNIRENEIVFSAIDIGKEHDIIYDETGKSQSIFTGYRLTQNIQIESKEVNKIEALSRKVTELINSGVELYSGRPEYYYTQLADLKIEMIAAATEDARIRAEKIAENSQARLAGLHYARMGVFQITAQNSSEDYSWGGAFNTSSKRKTATITMKLQFGIQ
ncbi:MAG: SIMPL domain-containing protein [Cyclobacteriaceae bacterium]